MLKIKDNIDLKELEKFGFEYRPDYYIQWLKQLNVITIRVEPKYHEEENKYFYISINNEGYFTDIWDLDLISFSFKKYSDNLVEDIREMNKMFNDLITARISRKGRGGKIKYE